MHNTDKENIVPQNDVPDQGEIDAVLHLFSAGRYSEAAPLAQ